MVVGLRVQSLAQNPPSLKTQGSLLPGFYFFGGGRNVVAIALLSTVCLVKGKM